ncbi:MAG: peptidylprolyl isomerase [candidate division WOR-3 bacterium]|jgi:peptidylprolyl isomerase
MLKVKEGDKVKVQYTLTLDDDTVVEKTDEANPFEFTLESGNIIPGFEKAVIGMSPGESKSVKIPPKEAYGERRDDMVMKVNRKDLPEDLDPQVGQLLRLQSDKEEPFIVTVTGTSDSEVIMDANHPLAGKNLNFEIELIEIL